MSTTRHHADWLSLVEVSGPFVSLPVLMRAFPQGLEARDPAQAKLLRSAYEEWQDNPSAPGKQRAWVMHVLTSLLGYPDNLIVEGQSLPAGLEANIAEQGETLRPDFALVGPAGSPKAGQAQLLIASYPSEQRLEKPTIGKHWKATPATRMMELLHGANVPLGLVTNGEQWMLVYAPRGETTGFTSWYCSLWLDEPITLRAFHSLLGVRRFFGVADDSTLLALLKESASDQQEVTDQLGYQVREAVEMLVQSFDALNQESQGLALKGLQPGTVYDAALTIMMRLVFLFSAEERGLLHLGKPLYDNNYAVSTLQEQLQEVADRYGEEVLERRYDAWTRLLATFRAVHGGIQHQDLMMQAYGGSLFDPDRYPFLEGREKGSHWRTAVAAEPLSVNNRVVLHLLNSLQRLRTKTSGVAETRRVSFRALGVEQIGHVYEGLLDHTAQRATEVVLGIRGTRTKEPEIPLSTLENLWVQGEDKLLELLKEETGRSLSALRKDFSNSSALDEHKLRIACRDDEILLNRLRPFAGLIREDSFERPWVVLPGSVFVTAGTTRRSTGTHYTPPSLTEPIVLHTLEPLVYDGPAEGWPKEQWKLKSPKEILDLKVCDMAMGSGAFLVQACRYLADRLVEAWENEEKTHPGQVLITPDGKFAEGVPSERLVPAEAAERIAIARRVVADRCLYGVDINPMAVEMAKLSMWLITVDANRPFTFLDHAFKCGDSLLGITSLEQLENFSLHSGVGTQHAFGTLNLRRQIEEAQKKREMLEAMPSDTPEQIAAKTTLYAEAEELVFKLSAAADVLVALELKGLKGKAYELEREAAADQLMAYWVQGLSELRDFARQSLGKFQCFHWALNFPEIMSNGGFDGFIGNPPFLGGKRISPTLGDAYRSYLLAVIAAGRKGSADFCAYFMLRCQELSNKQSITGLIVTNSISEGDTREVGLDLVNQGGGYIIRANPNIPWPGEAAVFISQIWLCKNPWRGDFWIDGKRCDQINSYLDDAKNFQAKPLRLVSNKSIAFQGTVVHGEGFVLTPSEAESILQEEPASKDVIKPYLRGDDVSKFPRQEPQAYVINFNDWPYERAKNYKKCMGILIERVKPIRDPIVARGKQVHEVDFWKFWDKRLDSYQRISGLGRVLFHPFPSKYMAFTFVPVGYVYGAPHIVIGLDTWSYFSVLQSCMHEAWVFQFCSTMGMGIRYAPSDLFETFPFPVLDQKLESTGEAYYSRRKSIMINSMKGLTETLNRVHAPSESSSDIIELRQLAIEMDQAVATAYGWQDLDLGHGFHETKQGIRFTISEAARREVLDRLLELNHQRYAEEVAAGLHEKRTAKAPKAVKRVATPAAVDVQSDLFAEPIALPVQTSAPASGNSPIVDYLNAHPGLHSKDAILSATGFPENRWNITIRQLLDSGQVERQGEKRGAKYQASPKGTA